MKTMKFSKRTGVLMLAVGASAIAGQGAAGAATPLTHDQVAAIEKGLQDRTVGFRVPLETVSEKAPMLPLGGGLSGEIPASPVLPPLPAEQDPHQVVQDQVVPPLNFSRVGPSLQTALPLPALADGVRPGALALDAPQEPLKAVGPSLGLGHPLGFVNGADGQVKDGALTTGDLDPRLIPGAVSALPGAKAELGGPDKHVSAVGTAQNLLETVTAAAAEAQG